MVYQGSCLALMLLPLGKPVEWKVNIQQLVVEQRLNGR